MSSVKVSVGRWYWLRRRRDDGLRMAFRVTYYSWRVADAIGRTRLYGDTQVERLFEVESRVSL